MMKLILVLATLIATSAAYAKPFSLSPDDCEKAALALTYPSNMNKICKSATLNSPTPKCDELLAQWMRHAAAVKKYCIEVSGQDT